MRQDRRSGASGLARTALAAGGIAVWALSAVAGEGRWFDTVALPPTQRDAWAADDRAAEASGEAGRIGVGVDLAVTPRDHGELLFDERGKLVWRLGFESAGAAHLSLAIEADLPPGVTLAVLDAERREAHRLPIRPRLATPIVPGDALELRAVMDERDWEAFRAGLTVFRAYLGYRGFGADTPTSATGAARGTSASCQVDVACPAGDPWRAEISAVVAWTAERSNGSLTFCTGTMVNTTAQDRTPYMLTADHCVLRAGNAWSLNTYFRYEHPTCRPVGPDSASPGAGDRSLVISGGDVVARNAAEDMTLALLDEAPPAAWQIAMAGWSRSGRLPLTSVGVHHPNNAEKRINTASSRARLFQVPGFTGLAVRFDTGSSQTGTSGSPLLDPSGRVVGQVLGITADVCDPAQETVYGLLARAWDAGSSSSARLRDWLDPAGTGATDLALLPPPELCAADADGDNDADLDDFSLLAITFGQEVTPGTGADLDGDGTVTLDDFSVLAVGFGCSG